MSKEEYREDFEGKIRKHITNGFQMEYDRMDKLVDVFQNDEVVENILLAVDEYAKQEAIGILKWYALKMVGFIEYIKDIRPTVTSDEIEEKMKEFEGQSFENLHSLYLKYKEQQ